MKKVIYLFSIIFIFSCEKEYDSSNTIKELESLDRLNLKSAQINRIQKTDANYIVSDVQSLYRIVASASDGEIIYLDENSEFDLSNMKTLEIKSEITIASSRNINSNKGPKLYSNKKDAYSAPKIIVSANNVRITGIRLIGPDNLIGTATYPPTAPPLTSGILCKSFNNLKVDNCEIASWSYAGIHLKNSKSANVVNNYIHHNQRKGLGYGVILNENSDALINYNKFDYNRHDIAGSGHASQSYEAAYNVVLHRGNSHSFDMHGRGVNGSKYAGNTIYIHHNTFINKTGRSLNYPSVAIRGNPTNKATIVNNKFPHAKNSGRRAIVQSGYTDISTSTVTSTNNSYAYAPINVGNNPEALIVRRGNNLVRYSSFDGISFATDELIVGQHWRFTNYLVGNWTGNGTSDIMVRNSAGDMYLFPFNNGTFYGQGNPVKVATNWNYTHYLVGNWTGNGTSDLIVRDSAGKMYLLAFNNGTFGAPVKVGQGWRFTDYLVGDWTGNGTSDLIVRNTSGVMYLFPFNNSTFYGQGGGVKVGHGWRFTDYLVGDWTGNGTSGIMVRNTAGDMYVFPFRNRTFYGQGSPMKVATNWNYDHYLVGNWSDNGTPDIITISNQDCSLKIFDANQFKETIMITRPISFNQAMIGDWE